MPSKHHQKKCLRTKEPFQRTSPGKKTCGMQGHISCADAAQNMVDKMNGGERGDEAKSVLRLNFLTWNYRDSFQSSENPECSQRWDIAQVHKLCHISAVREVTHRHKWQTRTQTRTPKEKNTKPQQNKKYNTSRQGPNPTPNTNPGPSYLGLPK